MLEENREHPFQEVICVFSSVEVKFGLNTIIQVQMRGPIGTVLQPTELPVQGKKGFLILEFPLDKSTGDNAYFLAQSRSSIQNN